MVGRHRRHTRTSRIQYLSDRGTGLRFLHELSERCYPPTSASSGDAAACVSCTFPSSVSTSLVGTFSTKPAFKLLEGCSIMCREPTWCWGLHRCFLATKGLSELVYTDRAVSATLRRIAAVRSTTSFLGLAGAPGRRPSSHIAPNWHGNSLWSSIAAASAGLKMSAGMLQTVVIVMHQATWRPSAPYQNNGSSTRSGMPIFNVQPINTSLLEERSAGWADEEALAQNPNLLRTLIGLSLTLFSCSRTLFTEQPFLLRSTSTKPMRPSTNTPLVGR